jgi:hypothetical protein
MLSLPTVAEPLLMSLCIAFTEPTFNRVLVLLVGAILARGRRTVTAILWTMRGLAPGHPSSYHRVLSRARWLLWPLGKVLATFVIALCEEHGREGWILIPGDDTVAEAKGAKVYGKGCHHDAVRSSHTHTVWRWGHRLVVLAVAVNFPWAKRPWALPVLVALYRPRSLNEQEGRRHKTPIELARGLMALLLRWFPDKKFVFLGDGGYASHEFARFFHRHRRRAALVSRFLGTAALYDPPPKYRGNGRPRVKGRKRKTPEEVVAGGGLKKMIVNWYSGTKREVKVRDGQGRWYKAGQGLVPVRWVFVRDETGKRRDEYFYTTNPQFDPATIIHYFTCRWSIETTFQEIRAHLGFETTRGRVRNTVLRAGPCLLGLFTVISLIYHEHLKRHQPRLNHRPGYEKTEPTFADAISQVRRLFWTETVFAQPYIAKAIQKVPPKLREYLLDNLCQAI